MLSTAGYSRRIAVYVIGLGLLFLVSTAWTQDAGNPNPPAAKQPDGPQAADPKTAETNADESIITLILDSGVSGVAFMVVLGLFSLVAATIGIERAVNTRRSRIVPAGFVGELRSLTSRVESRREVYLELCSRWTVPVSNILKAGLLRSGRPLPEVEKSMEDAAAREMAALRGRIKPLSVVGSVAPLVGLLGTVFGMILAFRTASQAGLGKGELMAQGIYMALLTTAAGLMIAIPALLLAAFYNSVVEKLFREIDENLMETMPSFTRMEFAAANEFAKAVPTTAADNLSSPVGTLNQPMAATV